MAHSKKDYNLVVTDQLIIIKEIQMAQIKPNATNIQYIKFFIRDILDTKNAVLIATM
ncbi:MAG: hypothetical protein V4577_16365 [Bacteroidota bacterium]